MENAKAKAIVIAEKWLPVNEVKVERGREFLKWHEETVSWFNDGFRVYMSKFIHFKHVEVMVYQLYFNEVVKKQQKYKLLIFHLKK